MRNKYLVLLSLFLLVVACKKEIRTLSEYNKYINDPDNGLLKERKIFNFKISVKLLPPDYLVLKEMKSTTERNYSKMLTEHKNNLTFILTLTFGGEKKTPEGDPVSSGLSDYEEYKERFSHLNFKLYEDIQLSSNRQEYSPVLISFENTYGQSNELNTMVVFSPKTEKDEFRKADSYTFIYNDRIFSSGYNKFTFKREDLDNSPCINFKK